MAEGVGAKIRTAEAGAPDRGDYLVPQTGEERADAQCPGLRVRCLASGPKVFFYRYRSRDGALREMKLGEVGPLTLAKARDAALRKRLEREQGKDPQLEKRKEREEATRERLEPRQAAYTLEDMVEEYITRRSTC